jgi:hypothetical protein
MTWMSFGTHTELGPLDLAAQNFELVAENGDLDVLTVDRSVEGSRDHVGLRVVRFPDDLSRCALVDRH